MALEPFMSVGILQRSSDTLGMFFSISPEFLVRIEFGRALLDLGEPCQHWAVIEGRVALRDFMGLVLHGSFLSEINAFGEAYIPIFCCVCCGLTAQTRETFNSAIQRHIPEGGEANDGCD